MLLLKLNFHDILYENLSDYLVDFMMYWILQSNICFTTCGKCPFFIRNWVGNQRKNDLKFIKISWNRLQIRWKIVQGTFWRPFGAPWGAQGVPDWILGVKSWFVGPPLDPQMVSIFRLFFNAKFIRFFVGFLDAFWRDFCIHVGGQNASQIRAGNGKRVFLVLSVSCRRELNLGGFGAQNR